LDSLCLQNDSAIAHLSLRYCRITSVGAKLIAHELGTASHQNRHLLTLDLAGNHVTDTGAAHFADALRLNRALLVLNLAGNGIGDAGATRLADVLASFELSHDEVVERRRLNYARRLRATSSHASGAKLSTAGRRASSAHHRGGARKRGASPGDQAKPGKAPGRPGRSPKQPYLADGRPKKDRGATRSKKLSPSGRGVEISESGMSLNASSSSDLRSLPALLAVEVLREATPETPTTLVRGNRTLVSLNLARNEIGEHGMAALLDAVLPLSTQSADPTAPGLFRLAVANNRPRDGASTATGRAALVPAERDSTTRLLSAVMAARDPLLRHGTLSKHASSTFLGVVDA